MRQRRLLVTGGAGFIGSALVRHLIGDTESTVVNVDNLSYSGHLESLQPIADDPRHRFEPVDIRDAGALRRVFAEHRPDALLHLAAESHVDRSIDGPEEFVQTNIVGTYRLLRAATRYWEELPASARAGFRFHHVSTDEVYGSLGPSGRFTEASPHRPNSPYAASKAASDHLARAWHHTYGLPVVISNCSNNYGPYQFPEKLIPLMILNGLEGKPLPVYGEGNNVRDWLHVDDHVQALLLILEQGRVGETYNVGGDAERTNRQVVEAVCALLDELLPGSPHAPHARLIARVPDRPGHDQRYAIDATKIKRELGWAPRETFASGLRKTVRWYLEHRDWCRRVQEGTYQRERLGLGGVT